MTAYDKALYLLGMREHGRRELEFKLIGKGYDGDEVSQTLDRLEDEGYLSDERFCESYIRSRLRRTPEGRSVMVHRLMAKGITSAQASSAVATYYDEHEDEIDGIFRSYAARLYEQKGEMKARATLMRKGIRLTDRSR